MTSLMSFETPKHNTAAESTGESNAHELIAEVLGVLEDGFPDEEAHQHALSSLRTAKLLASDPETKTAIDRILDEIGTRYGRL